MYLILECIRIKDVNNLVARRHYNASGPQAIIRLSGRLSHNGGEQPSINLLLLLLAFDCVLKMQILSCVSGMRRITIIIFKLRINITLFSIFVKMKHICVD